ncbi:MAG: hypothetical protein E7307_04845 [Butyrivibrio sp.]|nr:hypothetical protein [Butyrivibrio sp.]
MNKKLVNRLLSIAMAMTLSMTSVVPAYAMDDTNPDYVEPVVDVEDDVVVEEETASDETQQSGIPEDDAAAVNSSASEVEPVNNETAPASSVDQQAEDEKSEAEQTEEETDESELPENPESTDEEIENNDDNLGKEAIITVSYVLDGRMLNEADADKTTLTGVVGEEMTISLHEPSNEVDGLVIDSSFAGWYTTADYSDNDFANTDDTWTYTFTPDAEEVSLTFYAKFGEDDLVEEAPNAGEMLELRVETDGNGTFFSSIWNSESQSATVSDVGEISYMNDLYFFVSDMPASATWISAPNVLAPKGGYRFDGIYADSAYTQELKWTKNEYNEIQRQVLWGDIPDTIKTQLENDKSCTLYAKFVPIKAEIYKYTGCSDGSLYSNQEISIGETFPEIPAPSAKPGYTFNGWKYYDRSVRSYVAITPGVTKLELGEYKGEYEYYYNYGYNSVDQKYYVDVRADWIENTYTFNYHLNRGTEDLKTTKTYKGRQHNQSLDPSKGDLSNNNSFNAEGFKGWKVGGKEFKISEDPNLTIGDVMDYVGNQTTVDLFALWDDADDQTYTYVLKSGSEDNADTITRTATTGQAITFTGKEFTKVGYALTGWTTEEDSTIKITAKPKNLASAGGKATLTAQWTPIIYTVNYYASDEKGAKKVTATYNIKDNAAVVLNTENDVLKGKAAFDENEHGTLIGWTTVGEKTFSKEAKVQDLIEYANEQGVKSVDLYAQWNSLTYTVKFTTGLTAEEYAAENFTGSEYKTDNHKETVAKGETLVLSGKEYVREGWTLTGWTYGKTSVKATANLKDIAAPGNTVTLTAKWSPDKYTITYNLNGGSLTDKSIKTSVSYSKVDVPKAVTVTEETALLNYENKDGSFVINKDDPQVVRLGYEFKGWKENGTSYTYYGGDIYKKLTLVAEWETVDSRVTFDGAGGTIRSYNINHELEYRNRIYVAFSITDSRSLNYYSNRTSYPGYKLKAWKGVVGGKVRTYSTTATLKGVTEDITLTAEWTPVTYTLKTDLNGGKFAGKSKNPTKYTIDDTKKNEDAGLALQIPEKSGYIFAGYKLTLNGTEISDEDIATYISETKNDNAVVATTIKSGTYGDAVLTAKWTPGKYSVVFAEDSENTTSLDEYSNKVYTDVMNFRYAATSLDADKETGIIGFASSAANQAKKKIAYKLDTDYSVSKIFGNGSNSTVVVYPVYGSAKTYHIEYILGNATLSKKTYTYVAKDAEQTLPVAKQAGYTFKKWIEVDSSEKIVENSTALNEAGTAIAAGYHDNIILMPYMEAISYEVKFSPNAKDVFETVDDKDVAVANKAVSFGTISYESGETAESKGLEELSKIASGWKKTGYEFKGFGTSSKATKPITSLAELTTKSNITVYAIWKPVGNRIEYSSSFYVDYREYPSDSSYQLFGTTATQYYGKAFKPGKVSLNGAIFKGWRVNDKGWDVDKQEYIYPEGSKFTLDKNGYLKSIDAKNMADLTLTAEFSSYKYKIVINGNGGNIYGKKSYTINNVSIDTDVEGRFRSAVGSLTRKGYTLVGLAYDKAGKKPIMGANGEGYLSSYTALSTKNNGSVTAYAIWHKVDPAKPTSVTAALNAGKLTVNTNESENEAVAYEVQYSTNMFFITGTVTSKIEYNNTALEINNVSGSKYYVRVRKIMRDSTKSEVAGKWSSTVRASKTAD